MVDVMQPTPDMRICDPACGTGGFFLAAYDYIVKHNPHLDPAQKQHLRSGAFTGWEIVDNTARLCAMNMLLHGIESPESDSPIHVDDALRADPGDRFDMVLTNPPFGKKSSVTIVNAEGKADKQNLTVVRDDFWASTSNKQLNFVQHVQDPAEDRRPVRRGRARQRAVRGRRRRDDPPQAAPRVRRPHAAAPADRDLLRPGREGQRVVLRPQARLGDPVDQGPVDLRPAHQPALHAEDRTR